MSRDEKSIVDFLKAIDVDSSKSNRAKLHALYFPGKKYTGSYEQNVALLKCVKSLKFKTGFGEHFFDILGAIVGTPDFGPYSIYMSDKNPQICLEFSTLLFMAYNGGDYDFSESQPMAVPAFSQSIGLSSLAEHKKSCPKCKSHPLLQPSKK